MQKCFVFLIVMFLAAFMSGCSEHSDCSEMWVEKTGCECAEVDFTRLNENVAVTCFDGFPVYTWIGPIENLDDIREEDFDGDSDAK